MRGEWVTIVGAGNGGMSAAADLSLRNFRVTLFEHPAFAESIRPLQERGIIGMSTLPSTGLAGGFARPHRITTDMADAISEAKAILVIVPAFAHATLAREMAPHLQRGQVVVLMPGGFGGAILFRKALRDGGASAEVLVAESSTLPYACRKLDAWSVWVRGRKERFDIAAYPAGATERVLGAIRALYEAARPAANVLETGLTNLNPFIHPPTMLLNVGSMERGDRVLFYHEGVTPSVQRLADALDRERIALGKAFGIRLPSVAEVLLEHYGHQGARGSTYREVAGGNPVYRWSEMPSSVESRYLTEDIPMSLMPICALAEQVGTPSRVMRATITYAEHVVGRDLAAGARTLRDLGLEGLAPAEILRRL